MTRDTKALWVVMVVFSVIGCDSTSTVGPDPCGFPLVRVAPTESTAEFARQPHRCGQDPFRWSLASALGTVVDVGVEIPYGKDLLDLAALLADIEVPYELRYPVNVKQVAYLTQDRGEIIIATALIAYPVDVPSDLPLDIFLLLHGTSGFTHGCGPSSDDASIAAAAAIASAGWIAVVPDYIGLEGFREPTGMVHPYLVGQSVAMASLDAVRAARSVSIARGGDLCVQPRVAVLGGSEGGHAALWVDRLQPYYAPELELVGIVATVPAADVLGELERALNSVVGVTSNAAIFYGSASGWYDAEDRIDEVFVDDLGVLIPQAMASGCDPTDYVDLDGITDPSELFESGILQAAAEGRVGQLEPWGCMARENGLTTTSVRRIQEDSDSYGILFVLGGDDGVVNTPIEREAFVELCAQGMPLQFLECEGASHTETTAWAVHEIFGFLAERAKGVPFTGTCALSDALTCSGTPQ